MTGRIITCEVDESGGMAELAAAEALLAAAYGPGRWVPCSHGSYWTDRDGIDHCLLCPHTTAETR